MLKSVGNGPQADWETAYYRHMGEPVKTARLKKMVAGMSGAVQYSIFFLYELDFLPSAPTLRQ